MVLRITTSMQTTRVKGVRVPFTAAQRATRCRAAQNSIPSVADVSRRQLLNIGLLATSGLLVTSSPALAGEPIGFGITRKFIRPDDITPEQAVVVLMDARSVLRDIATLASTPMDSQERFLARKDWPGFAKRLRDVGPAAPIVAGLVTGTSDKEQTLSELYGGKSVDPGVTDAVYVGLGRVLTISGRTIRPEAQASPDLAQEAQTAIEAFLAQVPKDLYNQAQAFRVKRAEVAAGRS